MFPTLVKDEFKIIYTRYGILKGLQIAKISQTGKVYGQNMALLVPNSNKCWGITVPSLIIENRKEKDIKFQLPVGRFCLIEWKQTPCKASEEIISLHYSRIDKNNKSMINFQTGTVIA